MLRLFASDLVFYDETPIRTKTVCQHFFILSYFYIVFCIISCFVNECTPCKPIYTPYDY